MRRPSERTITAATVVAVGAILLGLAAYRGGWFRNQDPIARTDRVFSTTVVTPRAHLFADPVVARLDLVLGPAYVPVSSVRVDATFAPYTVQAASRRRTDTGETTRLTYRYRLACLTRDCVPPPGGQTITLPPAFVTYTPTGPGGPQTLNVEWPAVTSGARIGPADPDRFDLHASTRSVPAPTYRMSPVLLAGLASVGALALLLVAVVLLVPTLPRTLGLRVPAWARRRSRPLTPLERALARVHAAGSNGSGDERRALEHLALELAGSGEPSLALDARRMAWSPGRPPAERFEELYEGVERVIEAGR